MFLASYCHNIVKNATIYNSRNKGIMFMIYGSKSGKYYIKNHLRLFLNIKHQKINLLLSCQ